MYWYKLYKDIKKWKKFSKISKSNEVVEKLNTLNLRVDDLGRIYTVINIPEEFQDGNDYQHEAWVLQNLGPYNKVLREVGLAGDVFPEMSKLNEPGTCAYLLVLYPELDALTLRRLIINLIIWPLGFLVLRIIYKVLCKLIDFSAVYELIKEYVI